MGHHIVNGRFQSDKHPELPPDRIRLNLANPRSERALRALAQDYKGVDEEFSADLLQVLDAIHGQVVMRMFLWAELHVIAFGPFDAVELLREAGHDPERFPLDEIHGDVTLAHNEPAAEGHDGVTQTVLQWGRELGRGILSSGD